MSILPFLATERSMAGRQAGNPEAAVKRRQCLLSLERQYPRYLVVSLLPVLVMPWANIDGPAPQRLVIPLVLSLLVLQSLRTLPSTVGGGRAHLSDQWFRALGLAVLLTTWLSFLTRSVGVLPLLYMQLASLFLILSAYRLLRLLAVAPRVNLAVLSAAAAGYVHLGITGGVMATSIEMLHPGTFTSGQFGNHVELLDRLFYMSYVTIASLGYGDVLPTNALGQRFVILLSLTSTMYMSLVVGLLLGRYLSSRPPEPAQPEELP
jgi:hypothetical protein